MPKKGLFVPRLHDKNVRKLYYQANRYAMQVSQLLNLIVAVGLEQLEAMNNPEEWDEYVLVRPEEKERDNPVCSHSAENTLAPVVAPSQDCRIHETGHLASAHIRADQPVHHEHGKPHATHALCE